MARPMLLRTAITALVTVAFGGSDAEPCLQSFRYARRPGNCIFDFWVWHFSDLRRYPI